MATHYGILAWKIPWTKEPGGLQTMGLQQRWAQLSDGTATVSGVDFFVGHLNLTFGSSLPWPDPGRQCPGRRERSFNWWLPLFVPVFFFFKYGQFFKSLLILLQYCFHFTFFVCFFWLCGIQDLSSLIRNWTHTPCIGRQSLNHWTTGETSIQF